jgi:tRNA nucleotidyltransferase (CCA-adding enzyme)
VPNTWEHFHHQADIGVRGIGTTKAKAFEEAAMGLTAIVTDPALVQSHREVIVHCEAPDDELLLADWLNAVIYQMSSQNMLFGQFDVHIDGQHLDAKAWGEKVSRARHSPTVEPKGATYTELLVEQRKDGHWIAQCVVDV